MQSIAANLAPRVPSNPGTLRCTILTGAHDGWSVRGFCLGGVGEQFEYLADLPLSPNRFS